MRSASEAHLQSVAIVTIAIEDRVQKEGMLLDSGSEHRVKGLEYARPKRVHAEALGICELRVDKMLQQNAKLTRKCTLYL